MVSLICFFQAQLIYFNCPSLGGNHIIAFPLPSAQAVQAAPWCTAHSPLPASLAGRCYPSLTKFPALATLPGPCSLIQHPTSKAQTRQILGCSGSAMEGLMHPLSFSQGHLPKARVSCSPLPATHACLSLGCNPVCVLLIKPAGPRPA